MPGYCLGARAMVFYPQESLLLPFCGQDARFVDVAGGRCGALITRRRDV